MEKGSLKKEQNNYLAVINSLSFYEKEIINTFVNNDENKLLFFNIKILSYIKIFPMQRISN